MAYKRTSVTIRQKAVKRGRSLYLDIYHAGKRSYEFLGLYLSGQRDQWSKEQDRLAMEIAENIRRKRETELMAHGWEAMKAHEAAGRPVSAWIRAEASKTGRKTWEVIAKKLDIYFPSLTWGEIDIETARNFREKLLQDKSLSRNSAALYFSILRTLLRRAVRAGVLMASPMGNVDNIRPEKRKRVYLTMQELQRMVETHEPDEMVRRAFIFACLTGLRISDVRGLRWCDVQEFGQFTRLVFTQKKTGGQMYLDISPNAVEWMPRRAGQEARVFAGLPIRINDHIKAWAHRAGIKKYVTFHTSRHTFAVMMLTLGVDIYTVSRMLGHSDIKTTQIYADIVDNTRQDAVMRIPRFQTPPGC